MYEQPERKGVSGGVAVIVALIALGFGLLSGLVLGGAGGYLLARQADSEEPSNACSSSDLASFPP